MYGSAEANAIMRLYVDRTNDGFTADDILLGQTVARPLDGTNQSLGEWDITPTDRFEFARPGSCARQGWLASLVYHCRRCGGQYLVAANAGHHDRYNFADHFVSELSQWRFDLPTKTIVASDASGDRVVRDL